VNEDRRIQKQTVVLDAVEAVLELALGVLLGRSIRVTDLRSAADSGVHAVTQVTKRNLIHPLIDELGTLGPPPDEAHLTL
jgi:tRNA U38,U39,U40 pseudouridine synthase TruA